MTVKRRVLRGYGLLSVVGVLTLLVAWGLARLVYWRGTSVGPSPPLPTHYGETFTHHRPWRLAEAAPAPPLPAPVAALWGDNTVTQSFRACADNLAQMRVWLAGPEGTEVHVELRKGRERDQALCHARLRLHAAQRGRYYYLSFPQLPDSHAQMYWVVLWSSAPSRERSAIVRTATGNWIGGTFYLNGYPHPGTLDLTTYHRGWPGLWTLHAIGESILPRVFCDRLSQYKPSFFKAPAFGALLTVSAAGALGLLVVMWSLVRDRASRIWLSALLLGALMVLVSRWVVLPGGATIPMQGGSESRSASRGGQRVFYDLSAALQTASRKPDPRLVTAGWCEYKPCISVPAESAVTYSVRMPPGASLRFATGLGAPERPAKSVVPPQDPQAGLAFVVKANGTELFAQRMEGTSVPGAVLKQGQEVTLDLASYASQDIKLSFTTEPTGKVNANETRAVRGLWIAPQVVGMMDWLLDWPLEELPPSPQAARFGERVGSTREVELVGYDVDVAQTSLGGVRPGDAVPITLYWRALRPLETNYTVFVHLLDEAGEICGQWDSMPVSGTYPTTYWPTDVVVVDRRFVPLAPGSSPGTYRIAIGLYNLATLQRLPVVDATGRTLPDGRLILETRLVIAE